jgi:hypothetical protein
MPAPPGRRPAGPLRTGWGRLSVPWPPPRQRHGSPWWRPRPRPTRTGGSRPTGRRPPERGTAAVVVRPTRKRHGGHGEPCPWPSGPQRTPQGRGDQAPRCGTGRPGAETPTPGGPGPGPRHGVVARPPRPRSCLGRRGPSPPQMGGRPRRPVEGARGSEGSGRGEPRPSPGGGARAPGTRKMVASVGRGGSASGPHRRWGGSAEGLRGRAPRGRRGGRGGGGSPRPSPMQKFRRGEREAPGGQGGVVSQCTPQRPAQGVARPALYGETPDGPDAGGPHRVREAWRAVPAPLRS